MEHETTTAMVEDERVVALNPAAAVVLAEIVRGYRRAHGPGKGKPVLPVHRARPDYADTGHPRTTSIREDRIVGVLDNWLGELTDAEHRESTIAAVLAGDSTDA